MTSHLSVSVTASQAAPVGLSNVSKSGTRHGGFSSLLDVVQAAADVAGGNVGAAIAKLGQAASAASGETSLAVPLQATATGDGTGDPATDTKSQLMASLVASLAELDKALKAGQPVDQDLLKRVKQSVDAMTNFLAAQPPALQGATAGAAPDTTTAGIAASAATDAAKATLKGFAGKLGDLATGLDKSQPDLAARLADLAKALDPAKLSADTMAELGIGPTSAATDAKVATAINGLVNGQAASDPALQPALAAPKLKLSGDTSFSLDGSTKAAARPTEHAAAPLTAVAIKPLASGGSADNTGGSSQADTADKSAAAAAAAAAQVTAGTTADASAAAPASASGGAAAVAGIAGTTASAPQAADALRLGAAAYQVATPAAVNLPQMAFDIARHVQQGASHFQVRLDPADMGRVDVRLAIDSSGAVNAHLTVERPETLDLLKRDSASLSQALNQAGVDGGKTNLQFSLSQNPFTRQDNGGGGATFGAPPVFDEDAGADGSAAMATTLYRGVATASGVNIFV